MRKWLICFDWDGTLADSMDLCVIQIQKALERMQLPEKTMEVLRSCNGPTYAQSAEILEIPKERTEEFLQKRREAELEILQDTQKLFPGVVDMLKQVYPHAVLAIVSNGLPEYLHASMEMMGVKQYFSCVEPLIPGRSKAEAMQSVMDRYPDHAVMMIGDRIGDIEAGKVHGALTVAAGYGYGHEDEYCQADLRVNTIEELKALLLEKTTT